MTNDDIPADNPLPVREVGEPLAWIPRPSASPHTPEYAPGRRYSLVECDRLSPHPYYPPSDRDSPLSG